MDGSTCGETLPALARQLCVQSVSQDTVELPEMYGPSTSQDVMDSFEKQSSNLSSSPAAISICTAPQQPTQEENVEQPPSPQDGKSSSLILAELMSASQDGTTERCITKTAERGEEHMRKSPDDRRTNAVCGASLCPGFPLIQTD